MTLQSPPLEARRTLVVKGHALSQPSVDRFYSNFENCIVFAVDLAIKALVFRSADLSICTRRCASAFQAAEIMRGDKYNWETASPYA